MALVFRITVTNIYARLFIAPHGLIQETFSRYEATPWGLDQLATPTFRSRYAHTPSRNRVNDGWTQSHLHGVVKSI